MGVIDIVFKVSITIFLLAISVGAGIAMYYMLTNMWIDIDDKLGKK